jgi:ubiquinone/menaquinone biosynthesis C-methylase UbiE
LLDPRAGESVLDVGCGQGVYARELVHSVSYVGIDASKSSFRQQNMDKNANHSYYVADATKVASARGSFDHAVCILAIKI